VNSISKQGILHHVELYVDDLRVCKEFWDWLLPLMGYDVYQVWDQGISYRLHDTDIVLVQTEQRFRKIPYHRCHSGLNHLAFHADSIEFIDDLTLQLRQRGIPILYADRHPFAGGEGYYAVFFEDPQRMKVEVVYSAEKT